MRKYMPIVGVLFIIAIIGMNFVGYSNATSITTSQTQVTSTIPTTKSGNSGTLNLVGMITENVDQATFAAGAAPGCHGMTWKDAQGHVWSGIPLRLVAG